MELKPCKGNRRFDKNTPTALSLIFITQSALWENTSLVCCTYHHEWPHIHQNQGMAKGLQLYCVLCSHLLCVIYIWFCVPHPSVIWTVLLREHFTAVLLNFVFGMIMLGRWINVLYLPIFFRVTSWVKQFWNGEAILENVGKNSQYMTTRKLADHVHGWIVWLGH